MGNSTLDRNFIIIFLVLLFSIQNVESAPIDNINTRITNIEYNIAPFGNDSLFKIFVDYEILNNSSKSVSINFGSGCAFNLYVVINDSSTAKYIDNRFCTELVSPTEYPSGLTKVSAVPGSILLEGIRVNL